VGSIVNNTSTSSSIISFPVRLQRWRPLNGRLGQRTPVRPQDKVRDSGLGLRPRLCAGSVTKSPLRQHTRQLLRYINKPQFYLYLFVHFPREKNAKVSQANAKSQDTKSRFKKKLRIAENSTLIDI